MTAATVKAGGSARLPQRLAAMPLWSWALIALGIIALRTMGQKGGTLAIDFVDTDDATRMVQVRELLAGAPWLDPTTISLGGTGGMLTHWSRLVDLPIATLIATLSWVAPAATAEIAARAAWPLIVLAPLLWVIAHAAAAAGGRAAAATALGLAVLCPLGLYQFDAGRIDHHNVMIAATVAAALMMWAWPASRISWSGAGALVGLALAVGYEALAPAAAIAGLAAMWGLADDRAARPAQSFFASLAGALALAFVLTTAPGRWLDVRCDALSFNIVMLAAAGGAGLIAVLGPLRHQPFQVRFAVLGAFGLAGLGAYAALEPRCLAGPMGQLPKALGPIWLDVVDEGRSILADMTGARLGRSLGALGFFGLGIWCQLRRYRQTRRAADLFLLGMVTSLAAMACWQFKFMGYASLAAIPPIALVFAGLPGWRGLSAPTLRLAATVVLSQACLIQGAMLAHRTLAGQPAAQTAIGAAAASAAACRQAPAIRELAVLPPGLVAASIDLGAHIAAWSHHRALAGPYHRIAEAIIANDAIWRARDEAAAARLLGHHRIDYVVMCAGLDGALTGDPAWQGTLLARLATGNAPGFLTPAPLASPASAYRAWRVDLAADARRGR